MNIDAPIAAVVVYVDQARVTRRGAIHLPKGDHTLTVRDLPTTLDNSSVRATGTGTGIMILGVEVATRYVTDSPVVDVAALQAQLENLREQDAAMVDEDAQALEQLELLKSLREHSGARFARTLASGQTTVDALKPLALYLGQEFATIQARRRELASKRRPLARQIEAVERQLQQQGGAVSREWKDILIHLEAVSDTDLQLEVTYAVHSASWQPIYDIRLVDDHVSIHYQAEVNQQSGEDWPSVQLTLSTARPAIVSGLPRLTPWYIDRYSPPPPSPIRQPVRAMAAAPLAPSAKSLDMEVLSESPMPEVSYAQAQVESSGASVTFLVQRPVSIPSDDSTHKTTVMVLDLDAKLDYVIVPRLAKEAYLRAKIMNKSTVMLLPGLAQVFHGADYVGPTQFKRTIAPNDEFEVQLGVDDRIKVEFENAERTTTRTLIGNTRRVTVGYKIKLSNNLPMTAHLVISDQAPVSKHEDIKVKMLELQPKPTEISDLNIMKWELDLNAGTQKEIFTGFVLEYPRDMTVNGLGGLTIE